MMLGAATISMQIRDARQAQKHTQPDFALMANVGVRFILELEHGKESCQVGLTLRALQTLGIEVELRLPNADPRLDVDDELAVDFEDGSTGGGSFRP